MLISREGIENLSVQELQMACKERGMRALGLTQEKLVTQLKQWIELSTNEKVLQGMLFWQTILKENYPQTPSLFFLPFIPTTFSYMKK